MCISSTVLPILLISLGAVCVPTDAASVRCYEGSFYTFSDFSLDPANLKSLHNSPCFNASRDLYAVAPGYRDKINGTYMGTVVTWLLGCGHNVIGLNCEEEASGGILGDYAGFLIVYANAKPVGEQYGKAFIAAGLRIHCFVGFSWGAHMVGNAAVVMKQSGLRVTLIIALDAAGLLFDEPIPNGLSPGAASHSTCIITNPGGLGSYLCRCDVCVWVNCGNRVQPACAGAGGGIGSFTPRDSCSQDLSWRVTVDGSQNPGSYIARSAKTCAKWRAGQGSNVTLSLGIKVDTTLKGYFYILTNALPPYGRGLAGSNP